MQMDAVLHADADIFQVSFREDIHDKGNEQKQEEAVSHRRLPCYTVNHLLGKEHRQGQTDPLYSTACKIKHNVSSVRS